MKRLLEFFIFVLIFLVVIFSISACFPLRLGLRVERAIEIEQKKEAASQEREDRLATALVNGQGDFNKISPFPLNTAEVSIPGDYLYDPSCKDIYFGAPGFADDSEKSIEEVFSKFRNDDTLFVNTESAQGENSGYNGVFVFIQSDSGVDVLYRLFGDYYYLNGKCFLSISD